MQKLLERKISFAVDHPDEVTRSGSIRTKRCANFREGKMTRANFTEHPLRRQKAHDAIERFCVSVGSRCQAFNRLSAGGQKIGNAEFDNDAQCL